MLWHKVQGAGGAGGGAIEYIGSVTKEVADSNAFNESDEALDVLSIAQTGDLVVIALSFDNNPDSTWSWVGMSFTAIYNQTSQNNPGAYVGYRIVQSGDTNPYLDPDTINDQWVGLSVVASVFRGVSTFVSSSATDDSGGMPNPPSLTAAGDLWVITGHLDDDAVTNWSAPTNYTLADYAAYSGGFFGGTSSTAIAYRIESLSSDNPGTFGGGGSDTWRATTIAFS